MSTIKYYFIESHVPCVISWSNGAGIQAHVMDFRVISIAGELEDEEKVIRC